jgi:hypothetical protein
LRQALLPSHSLSDQQVKVEKDCGFCQAQWQDLNLEVQAAHSSLCPWTHELLTKQVPFMTN